MTKHVLVLGLGGLAHPDIVEKAKQLVAAGDFDDFKELDPLQMGATLGLLRPQVPSIHVQPFTGLLQVRRDSPAIVVLGGDARATQDGTVLNGVMVEQLYDASDATVLWRVVTRGKKEVELQVFRRATSTTKWWSRYVLRMPIGNP